MSAPQSRCADKTKNAPHKNGQQQEITMNTVPTITTGVRRTVDTKALPGTIASTAAAATVSAAPKKNMLAMTLEELQAYAAGLEAEKAKKRGGLQFGRAEQRVTWKKTEGRVEKVVEAKGDVSAYTSKAKAPCFGLDLQPDGRGNALQLDVSPSGGLSIKGVGQRGTHGSASCFLGLIANPVEVLEFFVKNRETCIQAAAQAAIEAESAKPSPKKVDEILAAVIKSFDNAVSDAQRQHVVLGLAKAPATPAT
jgi:hypothetical protein